MTFPFPLVVALILSSFTASINAYNAAQPALQSFNARSTYIGGRPSLKPAQDRPALPISQLRVTHQVVHVIYLAVPMDRLVSLILKLVNIVVLQVSLVSSVLRQTCILIENI